MFKCRGFQRLLGRMPNFSEEAEIIHFSGIYFRTNPFGGNETSEPDDDTQPFLACNALPPDPLLCPNGLSNGESSKMWKRHKTYSVTVLCTAQMHARSEMRSCCRTPNPQQESLTH